jgi:hypothetical protein
MKVTLLLSLILLCLISFNSTAQEQEQECKAESIIETAPASRFTNNGDGTVTDMQTGLMWARCRQGLQGAGCDMDSSVATSKFSWNDALALNSATSDTVARTDWRLPNVKELQSLVETSCFNPTINVNVFPNAPSSSRKFWSASPVEYIDYRAWAIQFYSGSISPLYRTDVLSVRLVRGGQ